MYGYRIEGGKPVIDPHQAVRLRDFFQQYISGKSLKGAAEAAGIGEKVCHISAKKMLMNRRYLGEGDYPRIISKDVFDQAEAEMCRRAAFHTRKPKPQQETLQPSGFRMRRPAQSYDDPATQAEYMYSLIDCEV